jgi:membrane protein YdbS with pleckstrin-like domain
MLLTQNPAFDTILTSIPRMIAMLTGEFNFENMFYTYGESIRGTTMAKIIFTAFVFVVHICVMNILVRYFHFDGYSKTEYELIKSNFCF